MLDALGKDAKRQDLGLGQGLGRRCAASKDAGKLGNLGQPAAVRLALAFQGQVHE